MGMINHTHIVHDLTLAYINKALANNELKNDVIEIAKVYEDKSREFRKLFSN